MALRPRLATGLPFSQSASRKRGAPASLLIIMTISTNMRQGSVRKGSKELGTYTDQQRAAPLPLPH